MKTTTSAKPAQTRQNTHLDGVAAKIGADRTLFDDRQLGRQSACAQQRRQGIGLGDIEASGDLPGASRDRFLDDGCAQNLAIENNGKGPPRHLSRVICANRVAPVWSKRNVTAGRLPSSKATRESVSRVSPPE